MAKRLPWAQLSPNYRARLEKKGLTEETFNAGASIKAARGHEHTPERPGQYQPSQFPIYHRNRRTLITQLETRKREVFGASARWSDERSSKWIREKPPTLAQIRWALEASDEELLDAIREDPATFTWLCYG